MAIADFASQQHTRTEREEFVPGIGMSLEHSLRLESRIASLWRDTTGRPRTLEEIQKIVMSRPTTTTASGGIYRKDFLGSSQTIVFGDNGKLEVSRHLTLSPFAGQANVVMWGNSVCHSDEDIRTRHARGELELPYAITTGHEGAALCTGVGGEVDQRYVGRLLLLDSHVACDRDHDHSVLDYCIREHCDGIVGRIRPPKGWDGPGIFFPGYFSLATSVQASAIAAIVPNGMEKYFKALSRCESLGNNMQIFVEQRRLGILNDPKKTVQFVIGLGATGIPQGIFTRHYGFTTIGIEPSAWRRQLALDVGACDMVFATTEEAIDYLKGRHNSDTSIERVVANVMSGHPNAYTGAQQIVEAAHTLYGASSVNYPDFQHLIIAFGLFETESGSLPLEGAPNMSQREYVFGGHSHKIHRLKTLVRAAIGRTGEAWEMELDAIGPDEYGQPKDRDLVHRLNRIAHVTYSNGNLNEFAALLNGGVAMQDPILREHGAIKFTVSHLPQLE